MLCSRVAVISHQAAAVQPRATLRRHNPRRLVAARVSREPDPSQYNGEGPNYTMKDVENLHEQLKSGPDASQYNGEGRDFGMKDVEAFHDTHRPKAGPDASQVDGEGVDYGMRDVEKFHDEAVKDKAVRRK